MTEGFDWFNIHTISAYLSYPMRGRAATNWHNDMAYTTHQLSERGGLLVLGDKLDGLLREDVVQLFKRAGVLVFRGFSASPNDIRKFCAQFTDRFLIDPSPDREPMPFAAEMQTVTAGQNDLGLHYEYGHLPFRPDIIWLFCMQPAIQDGQTTLCDGARIWKLLRPETQSLFEKNRLAFTFKFSEYVWRTFLNIKEVGDSARKILHDRLSPIKGLTYQVLNGTLFAQYLVSAVTPSDDGDKIFVGNIMPGIYPGLVTQFEHARPIPKEVIDEILWAANQSIVHLDWKKGDLAMVDNTKWLHGRRAFRDPKRFILTMTSFANASVFANDRPNLPL